MIEAQEQLQKALTTTFLANLVFLSEYDNDLYHRVDELSRMIENNHYVEKYALEFIMENGEFDIYDIVNDKYLYNRNPKKVNDELVRNSDFDIKNTIFNLSEHFTSRNQQTIDKNTRFDFNSREKLYLLTQDNMMEYSNTLKDFLENKKKRLKEINKFIFLGTLLGRHIPKIAEKINANIYLVLERNLEIFRLSLFTVDYTILAKEGVIFSIMEDSAKEEEKIRTFLSINNLDNYLLKFSTTTINIDDYVDKLLTYLVSQKPTVYDYNRSLYIKFNRATNIINEEYKLLLFNEIQENCKVLDKKPVLYIAAGPSIDKNMEWIKRNQNNFFIVTIGAAYKKLLLNKIKIDMITTLDEEEIINKLQFDDYSVNQISKNTIILANYSTNQEVLKKLKNHNLYLYETQIPLNKNNIAFSGFSVGELTLDILLKMNAKEIYLIGLDLALNQDTGLSHSENSNSGVKIYDLNEDNNRDFFSLNKGIVKVTGNLRDDVSTTSLFYMSIKYLEKIISTKSSDVNIYNLSEHGAYFEGTKPMKVLDVKINENFITIDTITFLDEYVLKKVSKETTEEIKEEIHTIEKLHESLLKNFKNMEIDNYEEFHKQVLLLIEEIKMNKYTLLFVIFDNYIKNLFPYLSYHFNDKKIKNESKKLRKIKNIFFNQIETILNDYMFCLKRIIK